MNIRYEICTVCDKFNSTFKTCKECGCFMPAKTLVPGSRCPLDKWNGDTVEPPPTNKQTTIKQNTTLAQ